MYVFMQHMYVCMSERMHVRKHESMYICMCAFTQVCMKACTHVSTYVPMYVSTQVCIYVFMHAPTHTHLHACTQCNFVTVVNVAMSEHININPVYYQHHSISTSHHSKSILYYWKQNFNIYAVNKLEERYLIEITCMYRYVFTYTCI